MSGQSQETEKRKKIGKMNLDDSFKKGNMGFLGDLDGKESACNAGDPGLVSGSGRSPGEGNGYPLQWVLLPGECHRQRSLAVYSP